MSWQSYLLDTNLILAYLNGEPEIRKRIHRMYSGGRRVPIPAVVEYEVMRGNKSIKDKESRELRIAEFEAFVTTKCEVFNLELEGWRHASDIYGLLKRQNITTDEGDILIMATARQWQRKVATRNIQDFEPVMGKTYCERW